MSNSDDSFAALTFVWGKRKYNVKLRRE